MTKKCSASLAACSASRLVAAIGDFVSNFTGKQPTITPEMAKAFGGRSTVITAKAQRELGFKIVSLENMAKDCYDWMVAERRI